nr:hypothetical protein Q903MT_gene151 [Picea sitchensis]
MKEGFTVLVLERQGRNKIITPLMTESQYESIFSKASFFASSLNALEIPSVKPILHGKKLVLIPTACSANPSIH